MSNDSTQTGPVLYRLAVEPQPLMSPPQCHAGERLPLLSAGAGLLLFGVVRRTLLQPVLTARFAPAGLSHYEARTLAIGPASCPTTRSAICFASRPSARATVLRWAAWWTAARRAFR